LLAALTAFPAVAITAAVTLGLLDGRVPAGPVSGSGFESLGATASYLVPLIVIVACLVGYAWRELSPHYAFAGGLVMNLAVATAFVLNVVATKGRLVNADWVHLVQALSIAASLWGCGWLLIRAKVSANRNAHPR
jgi:hypothetical protein